MDSTCGISTGVFDKDFLIAYQARRIAELEIKLLDLENTKKIDFVDFLYQWLSHQIHLQTNTRISYESIIRNQLTPYFQTLNKPLHKLLAEDINQYYEQKQKEGLSPNSVIRHHAILHSCFKYAMRNEMILKNPMDLIVRPKEVPYVAAWLDAKQLCTLLDASLTSKYFVPIFIAVLLGLRRSEIIALKWEHINLNCGLITVKEKRIRTKGKEEQLKKLKTKSSYRTLVLPAVLLEFLRVLKQQQDRMKKRVPKEMQSNFDFVCVDITDNIGELLCLEPLSKAFIRIINKTDTLPKVRFHDLRHSCATFLLHSGCSMRVIQEWLGHSSYTTTARYYAHIDITDKESTANCINMVLANAKQRFDHLY